MPPAESNIRVDLDLEQSTLYNKVLYLPTFLSLTKLERSAMNYKQALAILVGAVLVWLIVRYPPYSLAYTWDDSGLMGGGWDVRTDIAPSLDSSALHCELVAVLLNLVAAMISLGWCASRRLAVGYIVGVALELPVISMCAFLCLVWPDNDIVGGIELLSSFARVVVVVAARGGSLWTGRFE